MSRMLDIAAAAVFAAIGIVALVMAARNLASDRLLPFQQAATGMGWTDLPAPLHVVLLALMRVAGLGFAVVGALLIVDAGLLVLDAGTMMRYVVPVSGAAYCLGLAQVNRRLAVATGVGTPWRASLASAALLAVGIGLAAVST